MRISFDFSEKFSEGPSTTYQVKRAQFDKILADTAMGKGVRFFYEHNLDAINFNDGKVHVEATNTNTKTTVNFSSKFILDGSGFGRVLPRLLDLNLPSDFPNRKSIYCHFKDNLNSDEFEREKIIIAVHDHTPQVWFWLIGFNDGTSSLGVVCENKYIDELSGSDLDKLKSLSKGNKQLWELLEKADFNNECRAVTSFSSKVKSLFGPQYALLGNAGEFLDPVFSSGVTIALRSATLAAPLVAKQLSGEAVDWQKEFETPLYKGINTFRAYVSSWYAGELQKIILASHPDQKIKSMACSVLAGYAWDEANPFVAKPKRRLTAIANLL